MDLLTKIGENPENVTFATLFVGLLVWVMRANTDRENRYMQIISDLTDSLKSLDLIEKTVNEIKSKIER
ncbi:BhlA-like holin [Trichococcus patagoniensis]|uniref:BhlA-like holin n=1 Tax=Trichococcus patagoniensis TaxID=382641 RepID=A0A2T5ILU7_9LACT|nr:BhlA/UviB family holin-like peptide [Trichococcus patagoniensis]PTQ84796.1 BhlA-like holin [Trichococcus patagoniensis]